MNTVIEKTSYEPRNPKAQVVAPNEGQAYWMTGDLNTIKLGSKETNGALAWLETVVVPEGGPPPHIHHREDKLFYVMAGEVTFYLDDTEHVAKARTLVYVPKGTVHHYVNTGMRVAKMITLFVGGGAEGFFTEVGVATTMESTVPASFTDERRERFINIAAKYGTEVVL
jgi:mannose-6-phosphate isomerase-like protein (cupin superfamily)